ncbi:MAG: TfoX/Sxy family protein [Chloroflexi bacterium]|uniref:TfoX/Sxy family protein n=1 Tax=Candidatus Flexifilum breve TaxID=3140694 RepID=UPI0031376195|nr:TfoX/Sxy family protein [Chloroflexota bacterium]
MADLRNLGPKSRQWLAEIGITTFEEIERLGSMEVYRRLKASRPREVSLNMLYGLEAAILDIPWQHLPQDVKDQLKAQVD